MSAEPLHTDTDATFASQQRPMLRPGVFIPPTLPLAGTLRTPDPPEGKSTPPLPFTALLGAMLEGSLHAQTLLASSLQVQTLHARAAWIESLPAPRSLDEFFSRAADTLSDLRRMAAAFPDIMASGYRAQLDDIDKAMKLLRGSARNGGGGGGSGTGGGAGGSGRGGGGGGDDGLPPVPFGGFPKGRDGGDKPWLRRMAEALTEMGRRISEVARDIADALTSPVKATWGAIKLAFTSFVAGTIGQPMREVAAHSKIARAWSTFWYLGGKVTVGVLIGWLPGLAP